MQWASRRIGVLCCLIESLHYYHFIHVCTDSVSASLPSIHATSIARGDADDGDPVFKDVCRDIDDDAK